MELEEEAGWGWGWDWDCRCRSLFRWLVFAVAVVAVADHDGAGCDCEYDCGDDCGGLEMKTSLEDCFVEMGSFLLFVFHGPGGDLDDSAQAPDLALVEDFAPRHDYQQLCHAEDLPGLTNTPRGFPRQGYR